VTPVRFLLDTSAVVRLLRNPEGQCRSVALREPGPPIGSEALLADRDETDR
jgi:hypothetical protein